MAEWLKAHAWKACVRETVPWVRIPLSPPGFTSADPMSELSAKAERAALLVRRESIEIIGLAELGQSR